jgi:hypothetical protein
MAYDDMPHQVGVMMDFGISAMEELFLMLLQKLEVLLVVTSM